MAPMKEREDLGKTDRWWHIKMSREREKKSVGEEERERGHGEKGEVAGEFLILPLIEIFRPLTFNVISDVWV